MTKPVYAICEQQWTVDQISAFVIRCLDTCSIIPIVNVSAIPRLLVASEQAGWSISWSHKSEGRFSHTMA